MSGQVSSAHDVKRNILRLSILNFYRYISEFCYTSLTYAPTEDVFKYIKFINLNIIVILNLKQNNDKRISKWNNLTYNMISNQYSTHIILKKKYEREIFQVPSTAHNITYPLKKKKILIYDWSISILLNAIQSIIFFYIFSYSIFNFLYLDFNRVEENRLMFLRISLTNVIRSIN